MTASGAAAPIESARDASGRTAAASEALAQGLLLVRASTLNMVRLQLAMERCDRRVAIEAVDELLVLERRIGALASDLAPDRLSPELRDLERQHRSLAVERLVLAAGTSGPRLTPIAQPWIGQTSVDPLACPDCIQVDAPEEPRRFDPAIAIVILVVAALLAGAAAFLFLTDAGRGLISGSAAPTGVTR